MINKYLSDIIAAAKVALKYLHKNAWTIVFIIAGSYFVFSNFIDPLLHNYRVEKSYREATDPNRVAVLSPDMKRIRARQQEVAKQRSLEAEEEKKKKKAEEKERKRVKSPEELRWEKMGGEGQSLGDSANKVVENEGAGLRRRRP